MSILRAPLTNRHERRKQKKQAILWARHELKLTNQDIARVRKYTARLDEEYEAAQRAAYERQLERQKQISPPVEQS